YPPRVDETGAPNFVLGEVAATGTLDDGTPSTLGSCADYTSATGTVAGGFLAGGTHQWTAGTGVGCGTPAHLYCYRAGLPVGPPITPINVEADGITYVDDVIWLGANDFVSKGDASSTCGDWASGGFGETHRVALAETESTEIDSINCGEAHRVLCAAFTVAVP